MLSYEVDTETYDGFVNSTLNSQHKLPTKQIGRSVISTYEFNSFRLTAPDRNNLLVCVYSENSLTVNYSEPELVEASAIVVDSANEESYYIPSFVVQNSAVLPELRQSFHENSDFYEREADFKYHFPDGTTAIAVDTSNPVQRLDTDVTFTAIEQLGGSVVQKWLLETENGEYYYLRERSGLIKLIYEFDGNSEIVFQAHIGREHPGTMLHRHEILNIVCSMDYFNIIDNPADTVSDECHEEHWGDIEIETHSDIEFSDQDVDNLFQDTNDEE